MRPSPLSSIAQSVALVIVGLLLLGYVLYRTFSINLCGGFLICNGSFLPPFGNLFLLLEWIQHVSIILLAIFIVASFVMVVILFNRQDWDMISALRVTALFFAVHGLAGAASIFLGYPYSSFALLAGALTLIAFVVLAARILFTDNDEYRQATYLAVLGLVALLSVLPFIQIST